MTVTDEVYAEMEQSGRFAAYSTFGFTLLGVPVLCVVLAGMLYGAGYGLLGAGASFRSGVLGGGPRRGGVPRAAGLRRPAQLRSRGDHACPRRWPRSRRFSTRARSSVNLLNSVDLFHVWWIMILSIGLAVAWKRRTAPIATTLYGIYAGIALIIAVARTNLGF